MQRLLLSLALVLLLLTGCKVEREELPAPGLTPQVTSTMLLPSSTAAPTETILPAAASPSPTEMMQICSPLEGISVDLLAGMITNPYNPPPPGSDDPHAGIDLSDMLPDTQIAIAGRNMQTAAGGRVASVIRDRFPFGNAVIIETPLSHLPSDLLDRLDLPEVNPEPVRPISLTCPENLPRYTDEGERSLYILYAHMEQPSTLHSGDWVTCGQTLGTVGMSGNALNPHLHLEVRVGPSGVQFPSMAHYDTSASQEEMSAYCTWGIDGQFQLLDPMKLFILYP